MGMVRTPWLRKGARALATAVTSTKRVKRSSRLPISVATFSPPSPVAPVNQTNRVLLPQGLKDLKRVAREADLKVAGAVLNLDAGFDSKANRKGVFNVR